MKAKKEKAIAKHLITKDMTIMDIIDKKPEAVEVLLEHGLGCIGCAFSGAETIEEGALSHGMSQKEIDKIIEEINKV